ncbi:tetratricopeptide repeat protein [Candidatus Zixiibacteriota bacterium]
MPDCSTANRAECVTGRADRDLPVAFGAATGPDWAETITSLMGLAKEAVKSFDYDRAIDYLRTIQEIWDAKGIPEFSLELRFELHRMLGGAYASRGRLEEAIQEYKKILKLCRDARHLTVKSETFTQLGQLLCKQGDHERALGYLQRAISVYRRLNDVTGLCKALRNLGVIYVELGDFEEAEINYVEAIALAENAGDRMLYADLVNNCGAIMNMKGNREKALELYHESLEIYMAQDEIRKSAYTKNNIAITLTEQDQHEEALAYFQEAYEIATSINDSSLTLIVDINLADLYLKKNLLADAQRHCRKAERHLVEANLVNGHLVETRRIAGKIAFHEEDYENALTEFNEAVKIGRQIGAQFLEAEVLLDRGMLYAAMDRHFDALADLENSYRIYTCLKAEGKREETEKVINSIETLYLEIFYSIGQKVDRKDKYTKGHSDRVASLALILAKNLGLPAHLLKTIAAAALLHDIGKVEIHDSILKKAGRLTAEEFQAIKKHPELGVEKLRGKEFPWDLKPLILHHHEKLEGTGYPLGLKGEDIPMGARIICVADVFDALTSDRVYRAAYEPPKALAIMQEESGTTFDPVLLRCFAGLINRGAADFVINSRTRDDEMYSIWSQCMPGEEEARVETAAAVPA